MLKKLSTPLSRGFLLVVEGIDGAGKTTLIHRLVKKLQAQGFQVTTSRWRGSRVVGRYLDKLQKSGMNLTPEAYSMVHAADLADRIDQHILPGLNRGEIVICDRYFYTQIARDSALGLDPAWSEALFPFAPAPDLILYLDLPLELSSSRIHDRTQNQKGILHGEAEGTLAAGFIPIQLNEEYQPSGEPMNEHYKEKMFHDFQSKAADAYQRMVTRFKMTRIDATMPQDLVLRHVLPIVMQSIDNKNRPV